MCLQQRYQVSSECLWSAISFQHLPAIDWLVSLDGHAVIQVVLLSAPVEFYIMVFKIDQKHCIFMGYTHLFVVTAACIVELLEK